MTWTDPKTWIPFDPLSATELNVQLRDNMKAIGDAWTAYDPTLSGVTLGDGTLTGRYSIAGKLVHWSAELTLGSTSSVTGAIVIGLPALTRGTLFTGSPLGHATLLHPSTPALRCWVAGMNTAGTAYAVDDAGVGAQVDHPWTWAAGDRINFNGTYEAI